MTHTSGQVMGNGQKAQRQYRVPPELARAAPSQNPLPDIYLGTLGRDPFLAAIRDVRDEASVDCMAGHPDHSWHLRRMAQNRANLTKMREREAAAACSRKDRLHATLLSLVA